MTESLPPGADVFPASFAQERMWFLSRFEPDLAVYNISMCVPLTDFPRPFDPDRFEHAIATIAARHESLRTSFALEQGRVVQLVHPRPRPAATRTDLTHLDAAAGRAELTRLAAADAAATFSLENAPLWRVRLARLALEAGERGAGERDAWWMVAVFHHTIYDASSSRVLMAELAEIYRASMEDRRPKLADLPIQYADYAVWQRERLTGAALEDALSYWRTRLAGLPADTGLPTDRVRPPSRSYAGRSHEFALSAELSGRLREFAGQHGTTLFTVLLAAYQVLIARRSGRDDVLLGCPVAGRERPEVTALIGMFVNTLVLRTDVGGDPAFVDLLGRAKRTVAEALDHQDAPFEKLVEALRPDRDPARPPLCQLAFNLLPLDAQGQLSNGTAKFDLMVELHDSGDRLHGWVEYCAALFERDTVARLIAGYETLLAAITQAPYLPVSRLPIMPEDERERLLAEGNDTDAAYPRRLLHELVAEQVDRTPDAVAVACGDDRLTFRDLGDRASRLAVRLRDLGVRPGVPVGVYAERSPELVVGLLAVLEAGGAFVPLDPGYPAARLEFIIEDAAVPVVLAQAHLPRPSTTARVVLFDAGLDEQAATPAPGPPAEPDEIAYVIFTSGSTGRPKGVAVSHRAVVNRLDWAQQAFRLDHTDVVLQKTPIGFDVAVWEFFWPLIAGARLVLARPGGHREPGYLRDLIVEHAVTTTHFVPSMLDAFLAAERVEECRSLRRVICSGEELTADLVARFFDRLGARLHNLYGPTEAAIDVSAWQCGPGEATVPIGRPIHNTRLYVLGPRLEPLPVGVPGELFIGGVGLARGYLRRPGLTAGRFVASPYGPPGTRLYRSGDLARIRADGAIEYLGRIDTQVKIRGMRIELGEIETVLREQPGVRAAAVSLADGDRLVAYLVGPAAGTAAEPAAVRAALRRVLPEAMVPTDYVMLDALPVSANGKLDRAALPAPRRQVVTTGYVAPRTPLEEELCGLWAELLGRDRVGVDDDFFALGGHSLQVVKLVALICRRYGVDLPLRRCFEITTVSEYALAILEVQLGDDDELLAMLEDPA